MITRKVLLWGYVLSVGAAFFWGSTSVLVRYGVGVAHLTTPLMGALIAVATGTAVTFIGVCGAGGINVAGQRRGVVFYLLSGVAGSLGVLFQFLALSLTPVTVASPLVNTYPLFTLLVAHIFMGRRERLTWSIIIGATLIMLGGTLITLG